MDRWRTMGMVQIAAAAIMLGQAQAGPALPCAYEAMVIQGPLCASRGTPPATFIAAINESGMVAGWILHCTTPNVNLLYWARG